MADGVKSGNLICFPFNVKEFSLVYAVLVVLRVLRKCMEFIPHFWILRYTAWIHIFFCCFIFLLVWELALYGPIDAVAMLSSILCDFSQCLTSKYVCMETNIITIQEGKVSVKNWIFPRRICIERIPSKIPKIIHFQNVGWTRQNLNTVLSV